MHNITLFDSGDHRFILLNESEPGEEHGIRSNQYLICHKHEGILLDPGGFGVMPKVLAEMLRHIKPENIKAIFLSHQDPDIVAGLTTWIEIVQAPIYISHIWLRFIPHYGIKQVKRFVGIPDQGMPLSISSDFNVQLIPAHFLHSEGQFNVYDPMAKILFSGDIGAACLPKNKDYAFVDSFKEHLPFVKGFHQRYMCSNHAANIWINRVRQLDIEMLAPQHGPIYKQQAFQDFLDWFKNLRCGTDLIDADGRLHWEENA